jgi:hypothetical protein
MFGLFAVLTVDSVRRFWSSSPTLPPKPASVSLYDHWHLLEQILVDRNEVKSTFGARYRNLFQKLTTRNVQVGQKLPNVDNQLRRLDLMLCLEVDRPVFVGVPQSERSE